MLRSRGLAFVVALLAWASALNLAPAPALADHAQSASEAAIATHLSPDDFIAAFDNAKLDGLSALGPAPAITGHAGLDTRIRAMGEARGYTRRPLPSRPLVSVGQHKLQPEAADGWHSLQAAAAKAGHNLQIRSAFRGHATQRWLLLRRIPERSAAQIARALRSVALPGYSKHHTGYAIDISDNGDFRVFGRTAAYRWMAADNFANAKAHGWVPSYPVGASAAGPNPEAWEFVWVGALNIICVNSKPTSDHQFCDTFESSLETNINWLAEAEIANGCGQMRFCPDHPLTRGQAATFIWRYLNKPNSDAEMPFIDAQAGSYYFEAVRWMFGARLTKGTSGQTFHPERPITRAELATLLWRMASRPESHSPASPFADVDHSSYYANAVAWAARRGITVWQEANSPNEGGPLPVFRPNDPATRAEAAAFLHRFYLRIV